MKSGKPCSLTTEKVLKLSDVGFVFDATSHRRLRKTAGMELDDEDKHLFSNMEDF